MSPKSKGMFYEISLVFLKWSSIDFIPSKNFLTFSKPNINDKGKTPTAELTLYLPPTQSQKPKLFSYEIPNLADSSKLVVTAITCFDTILFVSFSSGAIF
jgi:hypothetical protein